MFRILENAVCTTKFKFELKLEDYLVTLIEPVRSNLIRLRLSNHKMPFETGRHIGLDRNDRLCNICKSSDIGDEYHYFCICPVFKSVRLKLLPRDCFVRPSVQNCCELLSSSNKGVQVKVAKFAGGVFKKLNNV